MFWKTKARDNISFVFGSKAAKALREITASYGFDSDAHTIRMALTSARSLMNIEKERGWQVILRDELGNEWSFSMKDPTKAFPIGTHKAPPPDKPRAVGNVIHFDFGKQ